MLAMQSAPQKPLIVVVESDQETRNNLSALAKNLNADVMAFSTASGFLDQINELDIACLMISSSLPDQKGIELIRDIKNDHPSIPIIMLAHKSQVSDAVAAMRAGCLDYVEKPFVDRTMLGKMQKALHSFEVHS